jgi:hypothetical protein
MNEWDVLTRFVLIGLGATAVMDAWSFIRRRLFAIALPDYGLVGRWLGHMRRGRFRHDAIAKSPPIRGERVIGWIAHSLIGVAFAFALLAVYGAQWSRHPTLGPALVVGIASVAAPFLLMQPGMGAGLASRRTANPTTSRLRSVITHAVFGFGLYMTARVLAL